MVVDLAGLSAVVTGGGTGIGRAIASALARCGAGVTIGFRDSEGEAAAAAERIAANGGAATTCRCDVTREEEVAALMAHAREHAGGVDILMANAGTPLGTRATQELTGDEWDRTMATNCRSVFYCVKHAADMLPDGRGRVVVTSSVSARSGGGPGALSYAAAKGAINNMVRNWAKELAPRGITANAIAPGVIWTRIHQQGTDPAEYRALIERIPLGRDGQPEDCVGAVLLLCSREGSYITGQTIEVNGGMSMP